MIFLNNKIFLNFQSVNLGQKNNVFNIIASEDQLSIVTVNDV
jgi:hypothetical protein